MKLKITQTNTYINHRTGERSSQIAFAEMLECLPCEQVEFDGRKVAIEKVEDGLVTFSYQNTKITLQKGEKYTPTEMRLGGDMYKTITFEVVELR